MLTQISTLCQYSRLERFLFYISLHGRGPMGLARWSIALLVHCIDGPLVDRPQFVGYFGSFRTARNSDISTAPFLSRYGFA